MWRHEDTNKARIKNGEQGEQEQAKNLEALAAFLFDGASGNDLPIHQQLYSYAGTANCV